MPYSVDVVQVVLMRPNLQGCINGSSRLYLYIVFYVHTWSLNYQLPLLLIHHAHTLRAFSPPH
jgi:hypothetical protein